MNGHSVEKDPLVWECGPHANAWGGHDARCRQVPRPKAPMPEQPTGIVLRVPLDRALDNRAGERLNVGVDHVAVPVVIDPTLSKRGETQNTHDGRRIVLREWNEQVLLHELLHVALTRISPLNTITEDPDDHNVIARIEVALWETGWRLTHDTGGSDA